MLGLSPCRRAKLIKCGRLTRCTEIPGFELGLAESVRSSSAGTAAPTGESSGASASASASDRSGPSSRHSSFSGSRHSSFSGEKKVDIEVPDDHAEIDTDDWASMDEEGALPIQPARFARLATRNPLAR